MKPTDESATDTLVCFHDNVPVRADAPRCLHPSSFCEFRTSCPVIQAEREERRSAGQDHRQ
jgi:hypothetical protein